MSMTKQFNVQYTFKTENGTPHHTSMTSMTNQIGPVPNNSETAVLSYLRSKHPGCDIMVRDLSWRD